MFYAGPVIKCLVITPNSEQEKTVKKLFTLCHVAHKFTVFPGSSHDLVTCKVKVQVVVSLGEFVSFVHPS